MNMFKRALPCFDPVRFWRHGLAVALTAPEIAKRVKLGSEDEVYITSLLHDIGIAMLAQHYPEDFERLAVLGEEGTPRSLEIEIQEFGMAHTEVAYHMAKLWRLPPLVVQGLRHHHTPPKELPDDLEPNAGRLIEVVQLADQCARRSGYSFGDFDQLDPEVPLVPSEELGITPETLDELVSQLDDPLQQLEQLYFEGT